MATIQIIDDDLDLALALGDVLRRQGYDTLISSNAIEGMQQLSRNQVDLVIVDILMPEKDGLETIVDIKKLNPQLDIIAISGGGTGGPAGYLKFARGFGARKTIEKPFSRQEILSAVREVLVGQTVRCAQEARTDTGSGGTPVNTRSRRGAAGSVRQCVMYMPHGDQSSVWLEALWSIPALQADIHLVPDIEALKRYIDAPADNSMVFVLILTTVACLDECCGLKGMLSEQKTVFVLPDHDAATVSKAYSLYPRFVSFIDEDPGITAQVLGKMMAEHMHRADACSQDEDTINNAV